MTQSTPAPGDTERLLSAVKRGFLLWSWIGLLGAYTSTSAVYGAQLISIVAQGVERYQFAPFWSVTVGALMLPVIILTFGWLLFSRYSRAIFRVAMMPTGETDADAVDGRRLEFLFTTSIMYLVFSWVAILVAILLPYVSILVIRRL